MISVTPIRESEAEMHNTDWVLISIIWEQLHCIDPALNKSTFHHANNGRPLTFTFVLKCKIGKLFYFKIFTHIDMISQTFGNSFESRLRLNWKSVRINIFCCCCPEHNLISCDPRRLIAQSARQTFHLTSILIITDRWNGRKYFSERQQPGRTSN